MQEVRFGTLLKAALLAGLVAGLSGAIFHAVVTEPVIERAIALEAAREAAEGHDEAPVVSRSAQRVGLFAGFVLYGLTWGLLTGATYYLFQQRATAPGGARQRLLFVLAAFWAVGLLPALKYPANPPGVGDPDTIGYRQALYVGFLALSVLSTLLAVAWSRRLAQRNRGVWFRPAVTTALLALLGGALFLIMPNNPDTVEMPAELVNQFRIYSIIGLAIFWAILGLFFSRLPGARPTPRLAGLAG